MLFVATCVDKPHSSDKRMENRPAHLAYLNGLSSKVKIGGALLASDHATPVGSMIIFEAESEDEVLALLAKDPYSLVELFESVSVRPWRPRVGLSLV
jgi:uncharacterized protein